MIQIKAPIIIFLLLTLTTVNAMALPGDSLQNINIDSRTAEFDNQTGTTTFAGQVVMQQGSMKITADKLVIYGRLENATKIVALGQPARFQQVPKEDAEPVTAEADTLEYQIKSETLFLINNASLDQDGTSLKGNRIEYDVQKALVKAGSTSSIPGEKDRVRMVIPPKTLQSVEDDKEKEQGQ